MVAIRPAQEACRPTHRVERVTSGVVVLDLFLDDGLSTNAPPVHMRYGDWTHPPVDFRFDPTTGLLLQVNLTLQDEYPDLDASIVAPAPFAEGGVHIDLPQVHAGDDRYHDQRANVRMAKTREDCLAVVIGEPATIDATDVGIAFDANHMLLVSSLHDLRGLLVRLSDREWQVVSLRPAGDSRRETTGRDA